MELGPVLEQRVTITPQMILANTLLHLSSNALEQTVAQELAENPALELIEVQRCPGCGLPTTDGRCPSCSRREPRAEMEKPVYTDDGVSSADYHHPVSQSDLLAQTDAAQEGHTVKYPLGILTADAQTLWLVGSDGQEHRAVASSKRRLMSRTA